LKKNDREDMWKERVKLEIAEELGLAEKIKQGGWGELNAVETGKIGGILARRLKAQG
jgi:hypothetical protein